MIHSRSFIETDDILQTEYDGINALCYSPDGEYLLIGTRSSGLKMWVRRTGFIDSICGSSKMITSIKFHPKLKNVALTSLKSGEIFKIDLNIRKYEEFVHDDLHDTNVLAFHPLGEEFIAAGSDGIIRAYDFQTRFIKTSYDAAHIKYPSKNTQPLPVTGVKYWPLNPKVFVTGGHTKVLKVWDSRVGDHPLRLLRGPCLSGEGLDIKDYSILTGSNTKCNALQIWDLNSSRLVSELPFEDSLNEGHYINCAKFFGDAIVLAGGPGTQNVQVIDRLEKSLLEKAEIQSPVITFDAFDKILAVAGEISNIKTFDLTFI